MSDFPLKQHQKRPYCTVDFSSTTLVANTYHLRNALKMENTSMRKTLLHDNMLCDESTLPVGKKNESLIERILQGFCQQ
jgi:hypothetical protein